MIRLLLVKRFTLIIDNSDIKFHLIHLPRCRIRRALNRKLKPFGTVEILGIDIDTYKKWIEF